MRVLKENHPIQGKFGDGPPRREKKKKGEPTKGSQKKKGRKPPGSTSSVSKWKCYFTMY